jgi:hypothetical protein
MSAPLLLSFYRTGRAAPLIDNAIGIGKLRIDWILQNFFCLDGLRGKRD